MSESRTSPRRSPRTRATATRSLPPSVTVGAFEFTVELAPLPVEQHPAWGLMEPRYERITIEPDQRGNFLRDTLLHEVLHACLFATGSNMGSDEEERLVASLTPVLLDTIRRNPDLVAFLTDG